MSPMSRNMYKCRPYNDFVIYFNTRIAFNTQIFVFLYNEISDTVYVNSQELPNLCNMFFKNDSRFECVAVKQTGNMLELDFAGCFIYKLNNCCY
jgi:hypothetical protein